MNVLDTMATRRSTRKYLDRQVEKEKIATILKAAYAAPVGHSAYKDLHLSVVQNQDLLQKTAAYSGQAFGNAKYNPFYGAPTLIIVSAKPKEDEQLVYIADVGCIMENMQLAATELGLGCVYLWAMLNRITPCPDLIQALNLPEGYQAISALALGYPETPLPQRTLADIPAERIATTFVD